MKRIVALLLCLCMLPVYTLAADDTSWVVGVWMPSALLVDDVEISVEEALGAGVLPIMVFHEDGRVLSVSLFDDGDVRSTEVTWESVYGVVVIDKSLIVQPEEDGTIHLATESREVILRRATEEEIEPLRGRVELPKAAESVPAEEVNADWAVGVWTVISPMRSGEGIAYFKHNGDVSYGMLVFREDGTMDFLVIYEDQTFHGDKESWTIDGTAAIQCGGYTITRPTAEMLKAVKGGDEMLLRPATEEEITMISGVVDMPEKVKAAAAAEKKFDWAVGVWTAASATKDGQAMDLEDMLGDGKKGMLVIRKDGSMTVLDIEDDGWVDANEFSWEPLGDVIISEGIVIEGQADGSLCAVQDGVSLSLRPATVEEIAHITGFAKLPVEAEVAPAESLWFLGTWEYLYSIDEGETEKSSILVQAGDYARVTFRENNTYISEFCIEGNISREELPWKIQDGVINASDAIVTLLPDGTMKVNDSGDILFMRRMGKGSDRLEMEPTVSEQTAVSGKVAAPVTGPALMPVQQLDHVPTYLSVSSSGRYVLGMETTGSVVLCDTRTGTRTALTLSAARSADGAQLAQEMLQRDLLQYAYINWSADDHYAVVVYQTASENIKPSDLYVLDAQTGELFAPAAWSKDRADDNFGTVKDAAFAPNGTLYFLLETSGKGTLYFGPTMLYACNLNDNSVAPVQKMPGSSVSAATSTLACIANGDVLAFNRVYLDERNSGYAMVVGAQRENMQQIIVPNPVFLSVHKSGMVAVKVNDLTTGTVTPVLFDLNKPVPSVLTGLVISSSGIISQLPVLSKNYQEVPGGELVRARWREVRANIREKKTVYPRAAAFSPDGTQLLLACTNDSYFLMNLATMQTTRITLCEGIPVNPIQMRWLDNDMIVINDMMSCYVFQMTGVK